MEFDFGNLSVPGKVSTETEPRAILRSLPVRGNAINDLWDGQAQALNQWNERRSRADNLILLNTGAGKSIVGLLIAESLRRETRGNVIYLCANNDLVRQVSKEAHRLGLEHTTRMDGEWSNPLYEQGKALCVTNYQALIQPFTTFRGEKTPQAIVLDDAHVAEGIIRDQFTLRVNAETHSELHARLRSLIIDEEPELFWRPKLAQVTAGSSIFHAMMCSPMTGARHEQRLNTLFQPYQQSRDTSITYPLGHLFGKWKHCAFVVGRGVIEITPPALPTHALRFFSDSSIRRVYLSATLDQGVDFARAFGRNLEDPIRPDVDAGNGERLILFSDMLGGKNETDEGIVQEVTRHNKMLLAVPSGSRAERWKSYGTPPKTSQFSAELDSFRSSFSKKVFVLVGRYDGIDLPNEACRIMAIDGVPRGTSLLERFMWEYLDLQGDLRSRIATRITQLFGRIIRGRVDYGAFFILSSELNNWLSRDRNISLLPELLRKQLKLGAQVHEQLKVSDPRRASELVASVLSRNEQWARFYTDFVNSSDVDVSVIRKSLEQQQVMSRVAGAWVRLWSALWTNDDPDKISRAKTEIEELVTPLATADSRVAGWLNIWLGAVYSMAGENAFAADRFRQARSRLFVELPLPRAPTALDAGSSGSQLSPLARHFLDLFEGGVIAANNRVHAEDRGLQPIDDPSATAAQFEEAVKVLGTCLGFRSSRPDNELDKGPDNLWSSPEGCVGIEAKTKKTSDAYNKEEIGQAHQHVVWMKSEAGEGIPLGLVLVGPASKTTDGASPSSEMSYASREAFVELTAAYKDLRQTVRSQLGASRMSEVAGLGANDEWTLSAILKRLRPQPFI